MSGVQQQRVPVQVGESLKSARRCGVKVESQALSIRFRTAKNARVTREQKKALEAKPIVKDMVSTVFLDLRAEPAVEEHVQQLATPSTLPGQVLVDCLHVY